MTSDLERTRDHARHMALVGAPADRALWRQIADEIDAHLDDDGQGTLL